ncbi:MAG: TetR/AcrR family transcriptional regulator [Phycisphaerae bacterium]|nr:TetR/AcrR family transcriptional regulator [Phycisphaerae bacterium]
MTNRDKRHQIMQAAERLFTSRRFHEVTTDQVAREAHVGKGTIYRHFKSKDDLFFETANSGFDELCGRLRREVPPSAPFIQQLLSACLAISGFHLKRQKLFGMMQAQDSRMAAFRGRLRERWAQKRQALIQAIAEILRRGAAQGQIRSDVPPEVLASFLLALLRTRAIDLREAPPELQAYELVVDLFLHGAGPGAPGGVWPVRAASVDDLSPTLETR